MKDQKKLLGEDRRIMLLDMLRKSNSPLTGSELAAHANVSRQVIVGDITLLKAKNEPIIATSQGYIYLKERNSEQLFERTIACSHTPEDTESELCLLVDHGVTVKDVKIEHPIYGDLTASIMVSSRHEVLQFIEKLKSSNASLLSALTDGIHLHTITASSEEALDHAELALLKAGYLIQ
ncbi:MAG: transcription repressor NadR [Bacillota bacterium]|nr:transcription repressor NadR [Bacillota bacterium]